MANAKFNWWWHHTPTYAHYSVEGTYLPILLTESGSLESARSAGVVLKSLTPNAQSVFKTLAEYQLANTDEIGKYWTSRCTHI
jgi:origin recognition complex subunit 2